MTLTETAQRIVLATADGESRDARTWPDGSYSCPFCSAAVQSPDGWAEMQRLNAEHYAKAGEAYAAEAYPRTMRLVWDLRGCPNPACLTLLNPVQLAVTRQRIADREAEDARRQRNHELAMQRIADDRAERHAASQEAYERCQRDGTCYRCWSHSTYGGQSLSRQRFVRHRDAANCPQARRFA